MSWRKKYNNYLRDVKKNVVQYLKMYLVTFCVCVCVCAGWGYVINVCDHPLHQNNRKCSIFVFSVQWGLFVWSAVC